MSLYALMRPETIAEPWPVYRQMWQRGVFWDRWLRCWLVPRYAEVVAALADPRLGVAMRHTDRRRPWPVEPALRRAMELLDQHVSFVDGRAHRRVRTVLARPYRIGHVRLLEQVVADVVGEAAQCLHAQVAADGVADFAAFVPLKVTQRLLGLDVDLDTVRRWSTAWGDLVAAPGHMPTGAGRAETVTHIGELIAGLTALVAEHRRTGRRDTVTGLLLEAVEQGGLSEGELVANLAMLVTAGSETTTNLISSALLLLASDTEVWELLAGDGAGLPVAVEELARLFPPTQYTARVALEDLNVGGQEVRRGEGVVLMLAAANRDPDAFPEPDEFRLDRERRHVSFGHGPHVCFGAALARLETTEALARILRGPRPQLAGPVTWRVNHNLRGLATLPLSWTADA